MSSESRTLTDLPDDMAVSVRGVSKCYRLYNKPSERLLQAFYRHSRKLYREIWAVRDVSFDLPRGSALGIVGRNGAGKSTLLQVMAGTLLPTHGTVITRGRVVALLELGSSFNTDFTGRENVFLYGAALGITREAMTERLGAILDFADIGDFIDQPLRTYSSGMTMRLAFAVQAHIDPSVLIIDEALAVGDIYFQHKCMRHIRKLRDKGVTLVFVSHAPDTVKRFCDYGLWMEKGVTVQYGTASDVVDGYLASVKMDRVDEQPEPAAKTVTESASITPCVEVPHLAEELVHCDLSAPECFDVEDTHLRLRGFWENHEAPVGALRLPALVTFGEAACGFTFEGRSLELTFMRHPWSGRMIVSLDGEDRLVDLYSSEAAALAHVNYHGLGDHSHRLIIQTLPERHPESKGNEIWLFSAFWGSGKIPFKQSTPEFERRLRDTRYGTGEAKIHCVELLDSAGRPIAANVPFNDKITLRMHAEFHIPDAEVHFSFIVKDKNGLDLFGSTDFDEKTPLIRRGNRMIVDFRFPNLLAPGSYSVHACVARGSEPSEMIVMDAVDIATVFEVYLDPNRPVWYMVHVPVEVAQRL